MPSPRRSLTGICLFAVYGATALFGHAGLHLLDGHGGHGHDGCLPLVTNDHAASPRPTGCCHHHRHTGPGSTGDAGDERSGQRRHQPSHEPAHDPDYCLICQHFAAKALVFAATAAPHPASGVERASWAFSPAPRHPDRFALPIRAPPASGC